MTPKAPSIVVENQNNSSSNLEHHQPKSNIPVTNSPIDASQDSLQAGASTLLYLANASLINSQAVPPTAESSHQFHDSSMNSQNNFSNCDVKLTFNEGLTGTQTQQSQQSHYDNDNKRDQFQNSNGHFENLFGHSEQQKARELWLPNQSGDKDNDNDDEFCLDGSYLPTNRKIAANISSIIQPMDRPSHWGTKAKITKRPNTSRKVESKNKKSKTVSGVDDRSPGFNGISRSGSVKSGMLAQFPLSKITQDTGKLDGMSFKPVWMKTVNSPHISPAVVNYRGGSNQEEIQEMEGVILDLIDSNNDRLHERRSSVSTDLSVHSSNGLSFSIGGGKEKENYHVENSRQTDWKSPGSSSKPLKNGKKIRAKAGSLRAIYQKLHRNIEEKECRMLNVKGDINDPQDPRNRATFFIDFTVNMDGEEEMWPFKIIKCYVTKIQWKSMKQIKPEIRNKIDLNLTELGGVIEFHAPLDSELNQIIPGMLDTNIIPNNFMDTENKNGYLENNLDNNIVQSISVTSPYNGNHSIELLNLSNNYMGTDSYRNSDPRSTSSQKNLQTYSDSNELAVDNNVHFSEDNNTSYRDPTQNELQIIADTNCDGNETLNNTLVNREGEDKSFDKDNKNEDSNMNTNVSNGFYEGMQVCLYFKADTFRRGECKSLMIGSVIRVYEPEILLGGDDAHSRDNGRHVTFTINPSNDGISEQRQRGTNVDSSFQGHLVKNDGHVYKVICTQLFDVL